MSDNGEAAANFNHSFGGLRDLLFQNWIQKPLRDIAVQTGKQNLAEGALKLSDTGIDLARKKNALAAGSVAPDYNFGEPPPPPAPAPAAPMSPDLSKIVSRITASSPTPDAFAPPGATTSAAPPEQAPDYSGMYFAQLPPAVKARVVQQYHQAVPHPEALTLNDIIDAHDARVTRSTLPPVNRNTFPQLGPVKATQGPNGFSVDYVTNPGAAVTIPGAGGGPSGNIMVNGEVRPDPTFIKPEDVQEGEGNLAVLNSAADQVAHIQDLIKSTPSLVGPIGGNAVSRFVTGTIPTVVGSNKRFSNNDELEQFVNGSVFKALGSVKLARATEKEIGMLQSTLPKLTSTPDVWQRWFDRFNSVLSTERAAQARVLAPYQQNLPDVPPAASVQPPQGAGNGTQPGTNSSGTLRTIHPGEEGTVKPGETVIWGPTGQQIRR